MNEILYLVIPCYNEQEVLPETSKRLKEKLGGMIAAGTVSPESRVLFVDDGSRDTTWQLISGLHERDPLFSGLKLAHNQGHQNALVAGLTVAKDLCDIAISMDADLQDDVGAIDRFVAEYQAGSDIVYGVRSSRKKDTLFKRTTAVGYYRFLRWMGVEIVQNHADYRLMSRRALEALSEYGEVNLFLRGIVPQIGYRTATVEYSRGERFAGESKYPLKKMISFAFDGITSFSIKPIRMITAVGLIIFVVSLIMLIYSLVVNALGGTAWGWTSMIMSIWLLGGLQLLAIGIIGEYVGKAYMETKKRPKYIIETVLKDD